MGVIMFCPKHLRFTCPDLPPKWVQLMTITLQVSQHRHILIETYLEAAHTCPPSKYVMITAVTQESGGGRTIVTSAIYLCLSQLHSTLTSPDKAEWIDVDFPEGHSEVNWRCWENCSHGDWDRWDLEIVFGFKLNVNLSLCWWSNIILGWLHLSPIKKVFFFSTVWFNPASNNIQ